MRSTLMTMVAALALQPASSTQPHQPSIAIKAPADHSIWTIERHDRDLRRLEIELDVRHFTVPDDGTVYITGHMLGGASGQLVYASDSRWLVLHNIEPGSHFWTFALHHTNGSQVVNAKPATLHVEVVATIEDPSPNWFYQLTENERKPTVLVNLPRHNPVMDTPRRHRLCVVTSLNSVFDGQKKIWLQLIGALPRSQWEVQAITFENEVRRTPFTTALDQLGVSFRSIPLEIEPEEIAEHHIQTNEVIRSLLGAFQEQFGTTFLASGLPYQLDRLNYLRPPFASRVWKLAVEALESSCAGAVLVFGNSRNQADQLLVASARLARVRAVVMEMTALDPPPLHIDALVAPSHFALHHPSVANTITAKHKHVLNIGIDTHVFHPVDTDTNGRHGGKRFTIGFVGRLATEKSIGLLLEATRLIAEHSTQTIRVRILGDGPLRKHFEAMSNELGLENVVDFVGGVYDQQELVRELQQLDAFVTLGFKETLGYAPLEAMSCGVPVIGFMSGGTGEFLEHRVNGIAIESPTPQAVQEAIVTLFNSTLRHELGRGARDTVLQRFSQRVGIQNYIALYERLAQQ